MKKLFIIPFILLLLFGPAQANPTFVWDHDCSETYEFRLYYGSQSGITEILIASVECPNTAITLTNAIEGYYVVTAYSGVSDLESEPSNEFLKYSDPQISSNTPYI